MKRGLTSSYTLYLPLSMAGRSPLGLLPIFDFTSSQGRAMFAG